MRGILIEAVVDSIEGALAAQDGGAQRVELCAALLEGGLTPSAASIDLARRALSIGLQVMIRPRGGDFVYTDTELAVMRRDIEFAKELGADGVVMGVLTADGAVDAVQLAGLVQYARPMSVTFHRAFDMVADAAYALEVLVDLGVDRVLTSGQEATALEGAENIAAYLAQADNRIVIMPGGGINERNIARIAAITGAHEFHLSGRRSVESVMAYRNQRVALGGALHPPEYSRSVTDAERIRAGLQALLELHTG